MIIFTSVRRCGGDEVGEGGFERVGFKKFNTDGRKKGVSSLP
jgi:hypothetical protein